VTLAQRQRPYKALTYIHLPVVEKDYAPGDMIEIDDLVAAGQTDEDIENLTEYGSLGEEHDDIHPSHIIPDPTMPTIAKVVEDAKRLVAQLEDAGEEVPDDVRAVAELDYNHATSGDEGKSGESSG
jgi:hypothetical protein